MDLRSDEDIIKKRVIVKQSINTGQVPDARQKNKKKQQFK
jgi:hypothetical protein